MARVAIVTGGTRGIGEAISVALKKAGYRVAANYCGNDERAPDVHRARREFRPTNGMSPISRIASAGVAKVVADLGPVDIVVNNAGITRDATMRKMTRSGWDEVLDTNLGGCFNMCKAAWDGMLRAQLRPHRQYRLDQRPGRPIRPGELRRRQIGHPRLHQGAVAGRRAQGHHRQRDRARLYRHRHGRGRAARRAGKDRRQDPVGRLGQAEEIARGCSSSSPTMPASSPARPCRSMAASTCIEPAAVRRSCLSRTANILTLCAWRAHAVPRAGVSVAAPASACAGRPQWRGQDLAAARYRGFLAPSAGTIRLRTKDGAESSPARSAASFIGWLGHQDGAKPQMTARETLGFFAALLWRLAAISAARLTTVGLARPAILPCNILSAGQKQRLALARLLLVRAPAVAARRTARRARRGGQAPRRRTHRRALPRRRPRHRRDP